MNNEKGRFIAFIENPYVQAVSAAFTCGMIGFAIAVMIAGAFFAAPHNVLVAAGLISLGAFGTLGFTSQFKASSKSNPTPRAKRDFLSYVAPMVGAAFMFGGAARYLGATDHWQTLIALVCGAIVCVGLALMSRN